MCHVQCHAVVGAVAAHLDAQRSDLAQTGEVGFWRGGAFAFLGALRQQGVAVGIVQPHVNAGRTRHAVTGDAEMVQRADHGFFHAVRRIP